MPFTLSDGFLAVLGLSVAVNGYFVREAFREMRQLRHDSVRQGRQLARHDERLYSLEGRPRDRRDTHDTEQRRADD